MQRLCFSGGARGADLAWGDAARARGYEVVHYSFPGHRTDADPVELRALTDAQLRQGNPFLRRAATDLGRIFPPRSAYVRKLLQRNYWQVRNTHAVYAVATLDEHGRVEGGTGWAVQLYMNFFCGGTPRLFTFDQRTDRWLTWQGVSPTSWRDAGQPPPPGPVFTGIGSRDLLENGQRAIDEVFGT